MRNEIDDFFERLFSICTAEHISLNNRYRQLREILEQICRKQIGESGLQMTDLAARIEFVAAKNGLSIGEQNRLHTFRLTSNNILNRQEEPQKDYLLRDIKTLAFFLRTLYDIDIPKPLYHLLPQTDASFVAKPAIVSRSKRMRVCFQYADKEYLYVSPLDEVSEKPLRVRYNVPQVNEEFAETCELLWRHVQLNLLDVSVDDEGILTPSFIALEPDYLIDISSLAECYKDYGHHPLNYQLNKLQPAENTRFILLGNITNFFLDEWIFADRRPDYLETMKKVFRKFPLELAACPDFSDADTEKQFFVDCKMHFEHIRRVVEETFHEPVYHLDRSDAVLEPSYICEALGLQGRLDYMQRDMKAFIEMKSGKADEYAVKSRVTPKENNRVQMLLYQAVLEYTMGVAHNTVTPYLLYTRYPLLYPARTSWAMVRRAINLRNRIVADEFSIQLRNSIYYTAEKIGEISPELLNEKHMTGRFWNQYLRPAISHTMTLLSMRSELECAYFYALYNFIVKEQYTSKSGDTIYDGRQGMSALWLSTFEEKIEAGEILPDLVIVENKASNSSKPFVVLQRTHATDSFSAEVEALPNFRLGDAVILYSREHEEDNVTNKLLFKGNIERIDDRKVVVRLRAPQHNLRVFSSDGHYALEHDSMDTSFRTMFQGLSLFLSASQERRDLLLGVRKPQFDLSYAESISNASDDFERIALKAQAAKDYFLLVGPPGTGKTSRALRIMVERFHQDPKCNILLLAYTNRAVDEICKALEHITPSVDFIRVGSELACEPGYRGHLIENILKNCTRRTEVRQRLEACRIFVGTVATLSGKSELFRIKHFEVAIIDEATQILEPQMLPLLCIRDANGENAIDKFVLVGDHKQLPAVVLQSSEQTGIYDDLLKEAGLSNLKESLFERLYRTLKVSGIQNNEGGDIFLHTIDYSLDMLRRQGRMHPGVAHFPNTNFYGGQLDIVGLPHQLEEWSITGGEISDLSLSISERNETFGNNRMLFFPSEPEHPAHPSKINHSEARLAAKLATHVYARFKDMFDPSSTLGIITPYRNQIALIKREIALEGIEPLNQILVDTVERFQGSERDFIIYSLCVNSPSQIEQLSNVIEDDGILVDRKLNVVLTRARKQNLIIGVEKLMMLNPFYSNLIKFIIKGM